MTCSRICVQLIAVSIIALAVAVIPVAADEQESRHRDNSGRQLAVVVPGMPHVVPPPTVQPVPVTAVHRWVPGQYMRKPEKPQTQTRLPAELSPQVKEAIQKGTVVAQGFQNIAIKRAGDVAAWVTTMWQQLNDTPKFTPVSEYTTPAPPINAMKPIAEPTSKDRQLYYTSERRLKTVVAQ